jgi:hypothetical protein
MVLGRCCFTYFVNWEATGGEINLLGTVLFNFNRLQKAAEK